MRGPSPTALWLMALNGAPTLAILCLMVKLAPTTKTGFRREIDRVSRFPL